MENFYLKAAFSLGPDEKVLSDPIKWAKEKFKEISKFSWKSKILPEKLFKVWWKVY